MRTPQFGTNPPASPVNSGLNGTANPWTKTAWTKTGLNSNGQTIWYPTGLTSDGGQLPGVWPAGPGKQPAGPGAGGGGGGLAAMLAPSGQGSWDSGSISKHPFQGLSGLLESSILSRLMSQKGLEGSEIRGLDGGAVAYGHMEDPFGRLTNFWDNWKPAPAPAVAPPRNRGLAPQIGNVFSKVLDKNGWPVEAYPGGLTKTGLNSDGTPTQYTNGAGAPIPNPYFQ